MNEISGYAKIRIKIKLIKIKKNSEYHYQRSAKLDEFRFIQQQSEKET